MRIILSQEAGAWCFASGTRDRSPAGNTRHEEVGQILRRKPANQGESLQMNVERAAIESIDRRQGPKPVSSPGTTPQLRIAGPAVQNRLQRLVSLAYSLLNETESLARDKAFTEASANLRSLNVAEGIDFYKEVEQFEIELIKLALDHCRGSQVKAAKLLSIRPTTLNSKIKLYGIQF